MSDSFETPWTVTCQAPLSMGFPRYEYWSKLQFSSPGDLSNSGNEPHLLPMVGGFFTTDSPGKPNTLSTLAIFLPLSEASVSCRKFSTV